MRQPLLRLHYKIVTRTDGSAEQFDKVVTDLHITCLKRTKCAVVLPVGNDARSCALVACSLDRRDIELDKGLALLDLVAVSDEDFEAGSQRRRSWSSPQRAWYRIPL